jgi:hypothetical protein
MIISKTKAFEDIFYEAYTKMYEATVVPVIIYASSIWGCDTFSCINAVQNKTARSFLI